jgi:uncharacterized protein (TIGR02421 family)
MAVTEKKLINRILDKIKKGEPLLMNLPGEGELKMDKPLPFLVVYRIPPDGKNAYTSKLGKTESFFIFGRDTGNSELGDIVCSIAQKLADKFKGFLILEVWLSGLPEAPPFTIHVSQKSGKSFAQKLQEALQHMQVAGASISAETKTSKSLKSPPYYKPLMDIQTANKSAITLIGLEIAPIYINEETGEPFPVMLRELRGQFSKALKKAFYEFVRTQTSYNATNFQMLGTTALDANVFEIDDQLAHFSNLFDFLLLVTPVNIPEAWQQFIKSNHSKSPVFHYRPLPIDPELIKRALFNLPLEDIADPTLAFLFRDKRKEIDYMLDMMSERQKPGFMQSSIQVFGTIDEKLVEIAKAILISIEPVKKPPDKIMLDAGTFGEMAKQELEWLKGQDSAVSTVVRIREDVEGIMVSRGTLNINKHFRISRERAFPLLQHEVGTHVVTYFNGKAQPLKLFYIGVPGYEELQEGLAVLAEYLTGVLKPNRMRTIAARVIAVSYMVEGNNFVDTFFLLTDKYSFSHKAAFSIVTRVFRGGGLTKDAVYLKGLLNLIKYIKEGNDLSALLIGKIRQDYLPFVQELIFRKILNNIPIRPRYLEEPYAKKIAEIKNGGNIFSMLRG